MTGPCFPAQGPVKVVRWRGARGPRQREHRVRIGFRRSVVASSCQDQRLSTNSRRSPSRGGQSKVGELALDGSAQSCSPISRQQASACREHPRTALGSEVARARDLRELEAKIHTVSDECMLYQAERNHFSIWLKARTEFYLAHKLRPHKVSDYDSTDAFRHALISSLRQYHEAQHRGKIIEFDREGFDLQPAGQTDRHGYRRGVRVGVAG